jgi:hypothetical protein
MSRKRGRAVRDTSALPPPKKLRSKKALALAELNRQRAKAGPLTVRFVKPTPKGGAR